MHPLPFVIIKMTLPFKLIQMHLHAHGYAMYTDISLILYSYSGFFFFRLYVYIVVTRSVGVLTIVLRSVQDQGFYFS